MNRKIAAGFAVVLACVIAGYVMRDRSLSHPTALKPDQPGGGRSVEATTPPPDQNLDSSVSGSEAVKVPAVVPMPAAASADAANGNPGPAVASTPPAKPTMPPDAAAERAPAVRPPTAPAGKAPTDPLPRAALTFVGLDAEAEAVWADAINDPARAPQERKDLIEDLNEDGFPDPKHVTPDDLPLIVSRLVLIEQLAPGAMDDVNAAAFAEAYKDLVEMFDKATR